METSFPVPLSLSTICSYPTICTQSVNLQEAGARDKVRAAAAASLRETLPTCLIPNGP